MFVLRGANVNTQTHESRLHFQCFVHYTHAIPQGAATFNTGIGLKYTERP